ncbi:Diacylglycerol lipase-alpha, partial [Geodia barretti]
GAGVASLLAILLKKHHQNLHCYAYSPPGGLLCMTAVPRTRSYITTVVVENDFIPRLSLQNLQSFSERILHNIQTSAVPKYRIFLSSGLQWLGLCGSVVRKIGNRRVSVSTMAILKEPLLNTHFDCDSFEVH